MQVPPFLQGWNDARQRAGLGSGAVSDGGCWRNLAAECGCLAANIQACIEQSVFEKVLVVMLRGTLSLDTDIPFFHVQSISLTGAWVEGELESLSQVS